MHRLVVSLIKSFHFFRVRPKKCTSWASLPCLRSNNNNNNHHNHHHCISKKAENSFPLITDADITSQFSHHEPGIARINNGSFGSCPAVILAAQDHWQILLLRQPDDFYLNHLKGAILQSRMVIKDLISADSVDEVSIVDNVTTATAIILQQVAWAFFEGRCQRGDAVVVLEHSYGAVKKSIKAYVSRAGASVIQVPVPFPIGSVDDIILEFRNVLEKATSNGTKVRLAVIDHVTSMPSMVIPVKELTRICREHGVDQVFVDAAHAMGTVEINVKEIGADFYTSNLHKLFFCPPSVAFLHCRKSSALSDLHHPLVSHEYGNGLPAESAWIGTRDYSSQLVVPSVVDFVTRFEGGIGGIRKRNHDAVVAMGQMLAKSWGTHLGSPPDMCSSMAMVGLPAGLQILSHADASTLRIHLRERFCIEVHTHYQEPKHGDEGAGDKNYTLGYARISHQVYNCVDDYYKFRDAINQLVKEGFSCETFHAN